MYTKNYIRKEDTMFNNGGSGILPVMDIDGGRNNGGGWGGDGGW